MGFRLIDNNYNFNVGLIYGVPCHLYFTRDVPLVATGSTMASANYEHFSVRMVIDGGLSLVYGNDDVTYMVMTMQFILHISFYLCIFS